MHTRIRGTLALGLACLLPAWAGPPAAPPTLTISHVTLIDGTGAPARPNRTVVVTAGRIVAVGADDSVKAPSGSSLVNGRGKWLIPGLWDSHVHLGMAGACALPVLVANGVTSVRDMGGNWDSVLAWRREIEAGTRLGPSVRLAGPILESAKWREDVIALTRQDHDTVGERDIAARIGVAGPEGAEAAVDSAVRLGADFIKVRTVASPETFRAIVAAAHRRGLVVAAHAPESDLTQVAVPGLGSIEHTETVAFALRAAPGKSAADVGAAFAKAGVRYTPTLITAYNWRMLPDSAALVLIADSTGVRDPRNRYIPPPMRADWRMQIESKKHEEPEDWAALVAKDFENLKVIHGAGVPLLAGTDLGVPLSYPGFSLHDELALLVDRGGLTPMEALESATRNAAEFFGEGVGREVGTVEVGKRADLVLLDADPLADIRNTRRIGGVVLRGRWLSREVLDGWLERAQVGAGKGVPRKEAGC
jgi:imidazolonepropionase-like amidohydrolase